MNRRRFVGLGIGGAALFGLTGPLMAALTPGKEYVVLAQPLAVETGNKVEVVEFFWYGCPHCFDLEPIISKWIKTLPKDVEFRRIPAIFRQDWVPGARIFYTLESLDLLQRLHGQVFDAMHINHINLNDESVLFDWVASKGVDRKKFADAYNSFNVQTKAKRAEQITRQSKIQGVPALIIDGKYMTSASMTGSFETMLAAADELIQKARAERKK